MNKQVVCKNMPANNYRQCLAVMLAVFFSAACLGAGCAANESLGSDAADSGIEDDASRDAGIDDAGQKDAGPEDGSTHDAAVYDAGGDDSQTVDDGGPDPEVLPEVSAGRDHSCLLGTDGSVACWGGNEYGQSSP
ncbi:MAG: hypothetical protein JRJ19_04750, partial [Deltaproteobacteria bacterium]|nr:hypothetical protein [Deltaproteobacteria bacterium]